MIWSLVGLGLLIFGFRLAGPAPAVAGLAVGFLKGRFLLAGMARGNAARIASSPGRSSMFAAFPLSSWGIALFFMALGLVLRRSGLSPALLGFVYIAAGAGLLVASCSGWRAWHRFRGRVTDP